MVPLLLTLQKFYTSLWFFALFILVFCIIYFKKENAGIITV